MRIPIFLCLFIIFTAVWNFLIRRGSSHFKDDYEDYIDREREANLTVRKKLPDDLFIVPSTEHLPFKDYDKTEENRKLIKLQSTVLRKAGLIMLKFDDVLTNTDLKLKYGINNLERITEYEENYNAYIKSLSDWGEFLLKSGNITDAELVFQSAIEFGSDLSAVYIGLAKIYTDQNQLQKLNDLKQLVEQSDLTMKDKILSHFD